MRIKRTIASTFALSVPSTEPLLAFPTKPISKLSMTLIRNCTNNATSSKVFFRESRITVTLPRATTNWLFALRISFYSLLLLFTFNLPTAPSRVPEKYIGIIGNQEDDEPRLERLKQFRALRKQRFDLVMKLDALTKEADELEIKDAVQLSSTVAKSLMDSKEYKSQKFVSEYLLAMRRRMLTAVAEVNRWKRFIISQHDAQEQAKLEYMSKSERQIWQHYFELLGQKKHLEEFLARLKKPDEKQTEELKAYNDLIASVKAKIFSLFTASLRMKKSVEEIVKKLDSPECRKNILLVTHQKLQSNSYALKLLKKASDELDISGC